MVPPVFNEAESMGLIHLAASEEEFDSEVGRLRCINVGLPTGLGMTKKRFTWLTNSLEDQLSLGWNCSFKLLPKPRITRKVAASWRRGRKIQGTMSGSWFSIEDTLRFASRRVLGYIPGNEFSTPGKISGIRVREVVIVAFCENFYLHNEEKASKHGVHF